MLSRVRMTATPLYPGAFMSERGAEVELSRAEPSVVLEALCGDLSWFGALVSSRRQKGWSDGAGGELWTNDEDLESYYLYVGEALTAADIEAWPDAADYRILLSNMRGNGWSTVVRTRCGNFQPVNVNDVVVPETLT